MLAADEIMWHSWCCSLQLRWPEEGTHWVPGGQKRNAHMVAHVQVRITLQGCGPSHLLSKNLVLCRYLQHRMMESQILKHNYNV